MTAATLSLHGADPLRPQPPGGMGRGALLALAVHALLVLALALSVHWRSQTPQTFSADLWAATPQVAAPRELQSAPVTPPPPPPPAPAPRVAVPAPAPAVDAKIAVEKARQDKEQADRDRVQRDKLAKAEKDKAERERAERDKAERDKAGRQAAAKAKADAQARREQQEQRDKQAEKQAEDQRLAKQREDNLKRMLGQAGATGAPGSTGSALKDAAPSASYAGKLIARIKPNIVFTETVSANPAAEVEVRASPTGTILSRRLVKSSGHKGWDEAVLRAIDRTAELPRDTDGRVPLVLVISFTPNQ
jgi:colicin import membrane protein